MTCVAVVDSCCQLLSVSDDDVRMRGWKRINVLTGEDGIHNVLWVKVFVYVCNVVRLCTTRMKDVGGGMDTNIREKEGEIVRSKDVRSDRRRNNTKLHEKNVNKTRRLTTSVESMEGREKRESRSPEIAKTKDLSPRISRVESKPEEETADAHFPNHNEGLCDKLVKVFPTAVDENEYDCE